MPLSLRANERAVLDFDLRNRAISRDDPKILRR
jgi:hypothetical protein